MRCLWLGVIVALPLFGAAISPASEPSHADWTQRRVDPRVREGWAFRPLQSVSIPASPDNDATNPIDQLLAAAQARLGIEPQAVVDRRTLLRRLSFTLTGLPPSPDDVAAFIADHEPDAIGRCVDRLLASPHYGVRWGRHWLDIARFAESHGYEHDYDRPTAYHYRDFVVQAFNADQPFDEFVRWQIAGDRLAPDDRRAWMATGFLAAGPHSTQITKREVERQRYNELDDMVSTIGTGLLGLNIGCARCHDHPYDPIPQADFYRLAANFTRTVRSDVELDFDPEGYRTRKARFDAAHAACEDAVRKYEKGGLRTAYLRWRHSVLAETLRSTWLLPASITISSDDEAQWTEQLDDSWTVAGSPLTEGVYSVRFRTTGRRVTAIRLEALSDPSMTHGGPGRDPDGNFALSGITITPLIRDDLSPLAMPIARAVSTFDQLDAGIAGVLDQSDATFWGVDPQLGRSHAAVFHLAKPVELRPDDELEVRLHFHSRPQASMGRIRLAFSTQLNPGIEAATRPLPERVAAALQREPSQVTNDEWPDLVRWFAPRDAEWRRLDDLRRDHAATAPQPLMKTVLVATEGRPAIRLHTQAAEEFLPETRFLTRGDPALPVGVATPGVLQVLSGDNEHRLVTSRPFVAKWLTDVEEGAGALLARVMVNRLWQHQFGTGLVATPDDFGTRGSGPSHPELLEWLAGELVRHDWQVKPIQRLLVTSAAFRRSSFPDPDAVAADPENRLLARWTPRRLEAEALRDAMLLAAGHLDDRLDGPSERAPLHWCRSHYSFIKRSAPNPWFAAFDAPDGCRVEGQRPHTTSPAQALALLNSEETRMLAIRLAQQVRIDTADPVWRLFQQVLQRDLAPGEPEQITRLLGDAPQVASLESWADVCQLLFCLDEFAYLD